MGGDSTQKPQKKPVKEITWISRDQDKIEKCAKDFKTRIGKKSSFKNCMNKIRSSVEHTMRKKLKKKPSRKKKEKKYIIKAATWVDPELLRSISLRSKLSRAWRYARKRKEPEQVLEIYKQEYVSQKIITAKLTGLKKSQWEVKKIEETWKDSKSFWKMIKELLGKDKEESDEAYIYAEDGEKMEIGTCRREFISKWTNQVYQKLKKANFFRFLLIF